jgi:hypothetical protein
MPEKCRTELVPCQYPLVDRLIGRHLPAAIQMGGHFSPPIQSYFDDFHVFHAHIDLIL